MVMITLSHCSEYRVYRFLGFLLTRARRAHGFVKIPAAVIEIAMRRATARH
jgi:hypothetical protein